MPSPTSRKKTKRVVLLAEQDVVTRLVLAAHMRECGFTVVEAADAAEAKAVLVSGMHIDVLFSDAQLAGAESGFALSQWVRRHRPAIQIILTGAIPAKIDAACTLCDDRDRKQAPALNDRVRKMMAERTRRMRRPSATAGAEPRRRKGAV